jgi:hypothetical protein
MHGSCIPTGIAFTYERRGRKNLVVSMIGVSKLEPVKRLWGSRIGEINTDKKKGKKLMGFWSMKYATEEVESRLYTLK